MKSFASSIISALLLRDLAKSIISSAASTARENMRGEHCNQKRLANLVGRTGRCQLRVTGSLSARFCRMGLIHQRIAVVRGKKINNEFLQAILDGLTHAATHLVV